MTTKALVTKIDPRGSSELVFETASELYTYLPTELNIQEYRWLQLFDAAHPTYKPTKKVNYTLKLPQSVLEAFYRAKEKIKSNTPPSAQDKADLETLKSADYKIDASFTQNDWDMDEDIAYVTKQLRNKITSR